MAKRIALLALLAALLASAPAWALELELAGIRLDQRAVELLEDERYGPPDFFGPLGAVTTWGITLAEATTPARVAPAPTAAPGLGAAPTRTAVPSRLGAGPRPGGLQLRLGGQREERRETAPPAVAPRAPTLSFGLGRSRTTPGAGIGPAAGPARPLAAAAAAEGAGRGIYWLYDMPGDARVVVGISTEGNVNSIVVSGQSYPAVKTEGGVKLGDSYTSVLDKYGFPDSQQNVGEDLVLRYNNAGLTLTLRDMRVQVIALAKPTEIGPPALGVPARAAPAAAVARPGIGATTPARPGAAGAGAPAGTRRPVIRLRLGGQRGG